MVDRPEPFMQRHHDSQPDDEIGTPIELHLRICVGAGRLEEFQAFLSEAIPFYEGPGGIQIELLQDTGDDHRFIEVVRYASEAAYQLDQRRVAEDVTMKRFLERWRALLDGPPIIEVYRTIRP